MGNVIDVYEARGLMTLHCLFTEQPGLMQIEDRNTLVVNLRTVPRRIPPPGDPAWYPHDPAVCPRCEFRSTEALARFVRSAKELLQVGEVVIYAHLHCSQWRVVEIGRDEIIGNEWANWDTDKGETPCVILPTIVGLGPTWRIY